MFSSNTRSSDHTNNNQPEARKVLTEKIEVACPQCRSAQKESASALSTYCRSCGQYFRITRAVPLEKPGFGGLIGRMLKSGPQALGAVTGTNSSRQPTLPLQLSGTDEKNSGLRATASIRAALPDHTASQGKDAPRQVSCFECRATHRAPRTASSTQCPQCSAYIDLKNIEIKERTTQRIRTRGDVEVTRKGALLATSIHCGSITVFGQVSSSIYASDTVFIRHDTKIIGEIRCRRFVIDRKCDVQCAQPIHAEEVEILGRLRGTCHASRSFVLGRQAIMEGSVYAPGIIMEPGAELNGQIHVRSPGVELKEPAAPAPLPLELTALPATA